MKRYYKRKILGLKEGFTLLELLVVVAVIAILTSFVLPSLLAVRSASLGVAGRVVAGSLSVARSEAISKHTAVRFGVVVDAPHDPDLEYRAYGLWQWDTSAENPTFVQTTSIERLPSGLIFDPDDPSAEYLIGASYAEDDPGALRGDYFLTSSASSGGFETEVSGALCELRYIEFRPSGAARISGAHGRNFVLVLTEGEYDEGAGTVIYTGASSGGVSPKNWVQFTVDSLNGRSRMDRP